MGSPSFVHLHNHTDYSMLDGAARVGDLVAKAVELGMPALAITDHGNMFGAFDFYKKAIAAGVKPIIGLEAYLTPGTQRGEKKKVQFGDGTGDDVAAKGAYTHMTILSETTEGMHNLFRLSSRSSLEGFFYKPRADRELLNQYHTGLIATTGCPSGEVQTYLRLGKREEALRSAGEFQDIFGADNYFVELMDHGLDIETRVRSDLLWLAKQLGAPLVATNDLHYVSAEDAASQDVLLCVSSAARLDDKTRFKFDGEGYYLRTAEQMRQLFSNHPDACDNTLAIAERCNVSFEEGVGRFMPIFDVPDGETEDSWFHHQAETGLIRRYGDPLPPEVRQRADYEMEVIVTKGYAGYFLVVADYIAWAKDHGIRVGPGRGSGAGSIIAYAMRITELDPLRYDLLFERFLNPERPSMPDFDVDFDESRRGEVIDYVTRKYGADHVAQIVTYGTIKAKQAVKDAARVLDKPYAVGERITKIMPAPAQGKDMSLAAAFDPSAPRYGEAQQLRDLVETDPEARQVVEVAQGIEGLKRQWGVHACGMIMSSVPLTDVIPIMKREADGAIITQFDYPSAESLGLVKMDFLGLRNLTILDNTINNIRSNQGVDLDLNELSQHPDDAPTFALLQRAETLGVFQLDSDGIRSLLRLMKPDCFEDISAVNALYRPGPMGANSHTNYALRKQGKQPITPIHPELEDALKDILAPTYGLIVYQEQVQMIARKVANYSLGRADLLRKAMGKKKKEVLDKEYVPFSTAMRENGYSEAAIQALWDTLVPFSDYAFNKSHTACYAMISYWTAYLKANYPTEYMAALLQSVRDDKDKMAVYLAECRRMGIQVLTPCVNESDMDFTAVGKDIRFGLAGVRNVGENVVSALIAARTEHGKAASFSEFLNNMPVVVCNRKTLESLIKAGAFDSMGHSRRGLATIFEDAIDAIVPLKRSEEHGQGNLFSFDDPSGGVGINIEVPEVDEWDRMTKLSFEREMLGLYVSDHPLQGMERLLASESTVAISALMAPAVELEDTDGTATSPYADTVQTICGMITQVTVRHTKQGAAWAVLNVVDLEASISVLVFPRVYETCSTQLSADRIVRIKGKVAAREDGTELMATEVGFPDVTDDKSGGPLVIQLPTVRCTVPLISQLKDVLCAYPGFTEVQVRLLAKSKSTTLRLNHGIRVAISQPLMADLKELLGPACVA